MRPTEFFADALTTLFREQTVATMPEMMNALGSRSRSTIFRKLRKLGYRTSYSHRGRYYTLDEIAQFDEQGSWSHQNVWFSVHGTLLRTATAVVQKAKHGHFVEELDNLLHVVTKDALRKLVRDSVLARQRLSGQFLYCAADAERQRRQLLARRVLLAEPGAAGPVPDDDVMPHELRAAIVLFFSLLDEKQRRLYAGLEALKTGRGGDARIAGLLGLHADTVARGRRELLGQDVEFGRVRGVGGGRKSVEKKHRK